MGKTLKTFVIKKQTNPTDMHVGSRVRIRRTTLGKSQTWLADAVGLTFQQIQKYEKGTNRISSSRLQQFANLLDVPVSFFFEEARGVPSRGNTSAPGLSTAYVFEFASSSDGLALIKAFMHIKNAKLRRGITKLVEQIADRHKGKQT
ncbi:MAG: helix-turn-helix transcriptional regulator [Pseudolabrys sp.]|nr:helix-turn-helix transcriptional regulator [Pseudolabrys sp.]